MDHKEISLSKSGDMQQIITPCLCWAKPEDDNAISIYSIRICLLRKLENDYLVEACGKDYAMEGSTEI